MAYTRDGREGAGNGRLYNIKDPSRKVRAFLCSPGVALRQYAPFFVILFSHSLDTPSIRMPSFAATVLFFPLLGLCSAKCLPAKVPQDSASPSAVNEASAVPTASATAVPAAVPAASQNATSGSKIPDSFQPGVKWQINIQNPVDPRAGLQPADAKVIDIDLFHASKDPTVIPALHVRILESQLLTRRGFVFELWLLTDNRQPEPRSCATSTWARSRSVNLLSI